MKKSLKKYPKGGKLTFENSKEDSMLKAEEKQLLQSGFPYDKKDIDKMYNEKRALELYKRNKEGHLPSVDEETGEWLKSKKYPTAWMELNEYALNPDLQRELNHPVINPEGYFGNDTLQYNRKFPKGGISGVAPQFTLPKIPQEFLNKQQQQWEQQQLDRKNMARDYSVGGSKFPSAAATSVFDSGAEEAVKFAAIGGIGKAGLQLGARYLPSLLKPTLSKLSSKIGRNVPTKVGQEIVRDQVGHSMLGFNPMINSTNNSPSNYNKPLVLQNDSYVRPFYIPQQRNGGYTPQNLKFYHGGILPKYGGGTVVPPTWKNMSTGAKTSAITQGALTTATALGIGEDNTILSSGLEMAGTGASIGANFGSWGAAIGAGAGALIGLGKGYFDEEDRIKQRDAQALVAKREQTTADINGGQNIQINNGMQTNRRDNFGTSPIVTGAHGGTIVNRRFYPTGGMVKQTQDSIYPEQELELQESAMLPNGDNMMVDGASHNEGGVKTNLPEGSRIFSDRLKVGKKTFADLARPIQNKIEKIKEKPDSKVNKNTIQLFEQQLDNIFNAQEELKASKEPKQQQQVPQEQMMQDPAMQEQMMQEQMAQDPAMQEQMMQEQMAQEQMMQQQAPQQGFAYGGWIPKFDVGGIDEYPEDERPLKVGWANNQINPNTLGGKRQLGLLPDENQMRLAQLENNQMQMRPLRPSNNPIKEFTNPSNNPIINPIRSYDKHQESNNWWSKQADERAAQEQLNNTRLNTLRQGQQDYDKAALEMKEMQKLPLPSTPKAGYKEMRTIQPTLKAGTETVSQDAYISAAEAAQRRKDAKTSNWSSGKIGQIGALSSSLLNKYAQERNINSLRRPTNIPGVALSAGARPRYLDYSAQLNRINAETNAANRGINLGSGSYSTQAANLAQTRAAQLRGTGEVIQGEQNANNTLYNTYRGQQAEVYNKQNMINAEINKENLANQYGFDTWRTGQRGKATADMYSTFGNVFNNMTSQQNQLDQATIMKNAFNPQVYANTIEGNAALAAGMTKEQILQFNKNNPDRQLPVKAFGGTISKYPDGGSVYKQKLQTVLNQPTVDQAAQMDADYASALAAGKTQYRSDITGLDYKVLTRGGKDLYAANLWNDTYNTAPNKKQVIATKKAIEGKPTASVKAKEAAAQAVVNNNTTNQIIDTAPKGFKTTPDEELAITSNKNNNKSNIPNNFWSDLGARSTNAVKTLGLSAIGDAVQELKQMTRAPKGFGTPLGVAMEDFLPTTTKEQIQKFEKGEGLQEINKAVQSAMIDIMTAKASGMLLGKAVKYFGAKNVPEKFIESIYRNKELASSKLTNAGFKANRTKASKKAIDNWNTNYRKYKLDYEADPMYRKNRIEKIIQLEDEGLANDIIKNKLDYAEKNYPFGGTIRKKKK